MLSSIGGQISHVANTWLGHDAGQGYSDIEVKHIFIIDVNHHAVFAIGASAYAPSGGLNSDLYALILSNIVFQQVV